MAPVSTGQWLSIYGILHSSPRRWIQAVWIRRILQVVALLTAQVLPLQLIAGEGCEG